MAVTHMMTVCDFRSFTHPSPEKRAILDSVSNLMTAIKTSLKSGCLRNCTFSVCFRRDVFNYLFKDKGSCVSKPGRLYVKEDFNVDFFNLDDFVFYNKFNECVCVNFPVYMYSYVKFVRFFNCTDFCESVFVKIIKQIVKN
jgi:hypothetical protein